MKVYLLGVIQTNFVLPWYKEFNNKIENLDVFFSSLKEVGEYVIPSFFNRLEEGNSRSVKSMLSYSLNISSHKIAYLTWRNKSNKDCYLKIFIKQFKNSIKYDGSLGVDCYHLHFATLHNVIRTINLPKDKILISFWGSDLLRNHGVYYDKCMAVLLSRVKVITIQNEDLKEIIGKLFGLKIESKVSVLRFPFDNNRIDSFKRLAFTSKAENVFFDIMVGHSGFEANNHIQILDSLRTLKINKTARFHLLISYGLEKNYHDKLLKIVKDYPFEIILYTDYLSGNELLNFRANIDLLIYAPESDAMSGTVTESLYANIPVIAGTWLPYSIYHNKNLPICFFDDFEQIPNLIEQDEILPVKNIVSLHSILDKDFSTQSNINKWEQIFELFNSN